MRPVTFAPEVETDPEQAVAWFDRQQRGLGDRFLADFRTTVGKISTVGTALRVVHGQFRHLKFGGFPYVTYFRDDGQSFYVTLVIGAARDPELIRKLLVERR